MANIVGSTKGKIVSKYCNISKIPGRGSIPPPPPPYHGGGMNLLVRCRVNSLVQLLSIIRKRYRRRSLNIFISFSFTFRTIHFRTATICDVNFICNLICIITQPVVVHQYGGKNFLTSRENDVIDLV